MDRRALNRATLARQLLLARAELPVPAAVQHLVPVTWIPPAGERIARLLGELVERYSLTANAIPDAQLAALALEHGLTVVSVDSDFARLDEIAWLNPLQPAR